jgi:hypothetical protein
MRHRLYGGGKYVTADQAADDEGSPVLAILGTRQYNDRQHSS